MARIMGFSELHQLDTFYNALKFECDQDSYELRCWGGNFLDKMPRECLKIIESKSKVRLSRSKAIVSKVSTSSSTTAVSSDVVELKDMVRALILDKKNQTPAPAVSTSAKPPTKNNWDLLFQPMFKEYFKSTSSVSTPISVATLLPSDTARASSSSSTYIDKNAPSPSNSPNIKATNSPINSTNVSPNKEVAVFDSDTFTNPFAPPNTSSAESSSRIVDTSNMYTFQQHPIYTKRWTKDHPLVTIIGDPSKPVSTRCQLSTDALCCYFHAFLAKAEPKNYKEAMEESCWIEAMQEEIYEFERIEVWELVPRPDKAMIINLNWIFKVKLDEYGDGFEDGISERDFKGRGVAPRACLRGIFINKSKYALEMLKKYGFEKCDVVDNPMVGQSKLDEDSNGTPVDPTRYREMVESLMYLTASLLDLVFAVCMCARTKHIAVRYHFIKEKVENEVVELYFVKTDCQLADIFTKALARERFKFLIKCLGMQSITPEELKRLAKLDEE
ncbi:hypothetical protein Tco_1438123 [Tanacetum coccineum]